MKFLSACIPLMCPGGASVILLVVIGLCGSNMLRIHNNYEHNNNSFKSLPI